MRDREMLYRIEEARQIGQIGVSVSVMAAIYDTVDEMRGRTGAWDGAFILDLMCTAYAAGILQGKREERQQHGKT